MSRWVRLWDDMPTDPKWRVVSRRSGRPITEVIAVFVFMMTTADPTTGALDGWDDEDVGAALDIDAEAVSAIRDAMQGKTIEDGKLSGWERRQPKRQDDNSTDRVRAFRERKRSDETQVKRTETHGNAPEKIREETETDIEPSANADGLTPAPAETPRQRLWSEGLPNLITMGVAEKQARSCIGKWLKDSGDDDLRVLGAIQRARDDAIVDPVPWITSGFQKIKAKADARTDKQSRWMEALQGDGADGEYLDGDYEVVGTVEQRRLA